MQPSPLHDQAKLLSALANEKRLCILRLIAEKEMAVGELAHKVGLSQSALSQHLAKLRADHLVTARRDAQNIYYSTSNPQVCSILAVLRDLYQSQDTAGPGPQRKQ